MVVVKPSIGLTSIAIAEVRAPATAATQRARTALSLGKIVSGCTVLAASIVVILAVGQQSSLSAVGAIWIVAGSAECAASVLAALVTCRYATVCARI